MPEQAMEGLKLGELQCGSMESHQGLFSLLLKSEMNHCANVARIF